eukprot:4149387-Pleurochrysis_carterae.AAC.3
MLTRITPTPPHRFSMMRAASTAVHGGRRRWRQPFITVPLLMAALFGYAMGDVEINCEVFDSTMACDAERAHVERGEIRTCSG